MYLKERNVPPSIKKRVEIFPSNFILASLQDSKGNLWFGSYQGGISYYDSRNKRFRSISLTGQSNLDVRTIYEDGQHNIWVGYSGGIVVLNPLTMKIIQHYNTDNSELHSDFIRSIAQDEKGRFWIGTFGDGLAYIPRTYRKSRRSLKEMAFVLTPSIRSYRINKKECG